MYFLPPFPETLFFPQMSTNTRPNILTACEWVFLLFGQAMPLAIEQPLHSSNLPTSVTPRFYAVTRSKAMGDVKDINIDLRWGA